MNTIVSNFQQFLNKTLSWDSMMHHLLHSNLAIGLCLLPSQARRDAFLFYHFCHTLDEAIDTDTLSLQEKENLLERYRKALQDPADPFLLEIQACIKRYNLDLDLFLGLLEGMALDLTVNRYPSFEALHGYAWKVAATVGLVSASIFGGHGKEVQNYAKELSMAFQLTNILRDVAEDAQRGRIYLPLEELARFQVSEEEILKEKPSPQATHLFQYQAERALSYFAKASLAWDKMSLGQRRRMRPARLMEAIYRTLLEEMQRDRYDLFYRRYRVSFFKKILLLGHILFSSEKKLQRTALIKKSS